MSLTSPSSSILGQSPYNNPYTNSINTNINGNSWTTGTNYWNSTLSSTDITKYDFENTAIDMEKILKMDDNKRKFIFDLILKFMEIIDDDCKTLVYNTLKSYNIFIDEKNLSRKIKIDSLK